MALEDAVILAEMVDRTDTIEEAFKNYEGARYLRTARIQMTSRQFGELYHASGSAPRFAQSSLGESSTVGAL